MAARNPRAGRPRGNRGGGGARALAAPNPNQPPPEAAPNPNPAPPAVPQRAAAQAAPAFRLNTSVQLDGGTSNQPTMIEIVSPDVPDQTGYSGRHYIDLGLDREQFIAPQCFDRNGTLLTFANLTATQYFGGGPQNGPQSAALITSNARLISRGMRSSAGRR